MSLNHKYNNQTYVVSQSLIDIINVDCEISKTFWFLVGLFENEKVIVTEDIANEIINALIELKNCHMRIKH